LGYFDRFERETMGSSHVGKVMLARAGLLDERGEFDTARRSLEALLASPYATGPEKCEALFRIGESHMREKKPARAVPYYQRIYVMHGKWRDWVARAYLRSGQAFEALDDTLSARRTYQELSTRSDLAEFEETRTARERLDALGGPLQDSPPAG
jgi:TolA-binding protein